VIKTEHCRNYKKIRSTLFTRIVQPVDFNDAASTAAGVDAALLSARHSSMSHMMSECCDHTVEIGVRQDRTVSWLPVYCSMPKPTRIVVPCDGGAEICGVLHFDGIRRLACRAISPSAYRFLSMTMPLR